MEKKELKIVQIPGRPFLLQGCVKVLNNLDFQKQYHIINVKEGKKKSRCGHAMVTTCSVTPKLSSFIV